MTEFYPFTRDQIARLRELRKTGRPMIDLVARMWPHTREEVVEAIDCTIREQDDSAALNRVNAILDLQEGCIPLINGRPAVQVARGKAAVDWRYAD